MNALTAKIGTLRCQHKELEAEVKRLKPTPPTSKSCSRREKTPPSASGSRSCRPEFERVTDELEGAEHERLAQAESIDELERLVDSFTAVAQRAPEFPTVLHAMRLMVGALASARRLHQAHPDLTEPADVVSALTQSLMLLAETLSKASARQALRE